MESRRLVENKSLAISFARSFPCYSVRRGLRFSSLAFSLSLSLSLLRARARARICTIVSILYDLNIKIIIILEKEICGKENPESSVKLDLGLSLIVTFFFNPFVFFLAYASVISRGVFGSCMFYHPVCYSHYCSGWFIVGLAFCTAGKIPGFPGRLLCCALAFTALQHQMSGIGTLCVRIQLSADYIVQLTVKLKVIVIISFSCNKSW